MTTPSLHSAAQPAGAAAPSSGELAKAFLTNVETGERIDCLFNPTEYSLSKSNTWSPVPMVGFNVPPTEFTGGGPTDLKLNLFFDTYEANEDVRTYTDKIFNLAKISKETVDSATSRGDRRAACSTGGGSSAFRRSSRPSPSATPCSEPTGPWSAPL